MQKHFEAAKVLLENVWFAKDHIHSETQTIDWGAIEETMKMIHPSTTELMRHDLAMNCYCETGTLSNVGCLDEESRARVLKAFEIMLS